MIDNKFSNLKSEIFNLEKHLKSPNFIIHSYKTKFDTINMSLGRIIKNIFKNNINQLTYFNKSLRSPKIIFEKKQKHYYDLSSNFEKNIKKYYFDKSKDLKSFIRLLSSNSLHANLNKGYTIVRKSNKIIKKSIMINQVDKINIQFLDKQINAKIKKIN